MYPLSGVCIADSAQRDAYCTGRASGVCNTCSPAAFLMNGGCYKSEYCLGSAACNAQSGGKCPEAKRDTGCRPTGSCTECLSGKYMKRAPGAATGSCIDPDACVDGCCISGSTCLPCAVVGCKICGRVDFCQECAGELFMSLDGQSCQGTVAATMCPATRRPAGAWLRPLGLC